MKATALPTLRRIFRLALPATILLTGLVFGDDFTARRQPDKALIMAIAAHPDDEPAGLLACYGGGLGVPVIWLQMTSGDLWWFDPKNPAHPRWGETRERECLNAARGYGLPQPPLFGRFRCASWPDPVPEYFSRWGGKETALRYVVTQLRKYRPEVVWSHATNGDYGHNDHYACSIITREAVIAAADPARFRDLPEPNRPWQVKKLYLNYGGKDGFYSMHDAKLPGLGGRGTSQAATDGYRSHVSQGTAKAVIGAGLHVTLWSSTVGPDIAADNILENLDLAAWKPRTIHGTVELAAGEPSPAGGTRLFLWSINEAKLYWRYSLFIPAGKRSVWFHLNRGIETGKTFLVGVQRDAQGQHPARFWHPAGMRPENEAARVRFVPEGVRLRLIVPSAVTR